MASATEQRMSKAAELRRSTKPIMEKRRRARINHSLMELKSLILDALKKDQARHNKLEKADILEMTVKHLQTLRRQQVAKTIASDVTVSDKYRAGFGECVSEVGRYLSRVDGLDTSVRQCLLNHLSSSMTTIQSPPVTPSSATTPQFFNGLPLVPTRLPTGEIALVLQSSMVSQTEPISIYTHHNQSMSSGVMSPAASERSSSSPVSSLGQATWSSSPDNIKLEEDVWRPW